jgi:hypothetical protein
MLNFIEPRSLNPCLKWPLIKFPYFADTTERGDSGWKQAQRQGEDRVTFQMTLMWFLKKLPLKKKKSDPTAPV